VDPVNREYKLKQGFWDLNIGSARQKRRGKRYLADSQFILGSILKRKGKRKERK